MAKVKTINLTINSIGYDLPISCSIQGIFKLKIPDALKKEFGIHIDTIEHKTLVAVENEINGYVSAYKKRTVTEELYIAISFKCNGDFAITLDKQHLKVPRMGNGHSDFKNGLSLDFQICYKRTVDGKVRWHRAYLGNNRWWGMNGKDFNGNLIALTDDYENRYFISDEDYFLSTNYSKYIPYSIESLNTLENALEKFKIISQQLSDFINSDIETIQTILTGKKLLSIH